MLLLTVTPKNKTALWDLLEESRSLEAFGRMQKILEESRRTGKSETDEIRRNCDRFGGGESSHATHI